MTGNLRLEIANMPKMAMSDSLSAAARAWPVALNLLLR